MSGSSYFVLWHIVVFIRCTPSVDISARVRRRFECYCCSSRRYCYGYYCLLIGHRISISNTKSLLNILRNEGLETESVERAEKRGRRIEGGEEGRGAGVMMMSNSAGGGGNNGGTASRHQPSSGEAAAATRLRRLQRLCSRTNGDDGGWCIRYLRLAPRSLDSVLPGNWYGVRDVCLFSLCFVNQNYIAYDIRTHRKLNKKVNPCRCGLVAFLLFHTRYDEQQSVGVGVLLLAFFYCISHFFISVMGPRVCVGVLSYTL